MGPDDILPTDAGTVVETPASEPAPAPAPAPAPEPQEPAKPVSARDSVKAAFEQLSKEPQGGEQRPGEPIPQPGRDPATGRFAPRAGQPAALKPGDAPAAPAVVVGPVKGAQPAAPIAPSGPPPGWSVASKAAWDALPDHIRADIAKREADFEQGYRKLEADSGANRALLPYHEMAQKSGTTLDAAVKRYVDHETLLRRDPAQGLMSIAKNVGLSQEQAANLFAQLAQRLGARASQQNGGFPNGSEQNDPLAEVIGPLIERAIGPMAQKFSAFETHLTRQQQAEQNAQQRGVAEAIEKFAADPKHRYMPELVETISRLFETGMVERTADPVGDLARAYEMAAYQHPEVRETLVSERLKARADEAKAKAAAAQRAAVSLNGYPAAGASAPARGAAGMSAHDSVRAAMNQLRSGV